ncbi:MAG: methyltransferase domain-containing protein [Thiolinea sp.]
MKKDRIFDGLSQRFQRKIYSNDDPRGAIRLHIIQDDIRTQSFLDQRLHVLDAGAGMGQMSCWLAQQGHTIVLAEPSQEMLEVAKQNIQETLGQHSSLITPKQDTIQSLCDDTLHQHFDFIVCHAVLEWLASPLENLAQLLNTLKPGGWLSLMFFNRHSKVMRHLVGGDLKPVLENRIASDGHNGLAPISPLVPDDVANWLIDSGLEVITWSGVRCFYDYSHPEVRKRMDLQDVLTLERRFSQQEPWRSLARYQHMLCYKPT